MPDKPPLKISVITTSFNHAWYLPDTINSVLGQNYPHLEYFLLDGGSTDQSPKIIAAYARDYPQTIRWRSHPDAGHAAALNEGFRQATGDIVAFINSDDYYLSGSFRTVSDYFGSHPGCQWIVGDCRVTSFWLSWTFLIKHLWPIDKYFWPLLVFNTINQPAVFLRRSFIHRVGLLDTSLKYSFDYDYWLRCARFSLPHRLHSYLAVFRVHSAALGSTRYRGQFIEDLSIVRKYTSASLFILWHWSITCLTLAGYRLLKK